MNNQEIKDWWDVALKSIPWHKPEQSIINTINKINDSKKYLRLQQGHTIIRLKGDPEHTPTVSQFPPTKGKLIDHWIVPVQVRGRHNWKPVQYLSMGKALFRQIMEIKRVTDTNQFRIVVDKNAGPSGYYTVYPHS